MKIGPSNQRNQLLKIKHVEKIVGKSNNKIFNSSACGHRCSSMNVATIGDYGLTKLLLMIFSFGTLVGKWEIVIRKD